MREIKKYRYKKGWSVATVALIVSVIFSTSITAITSKQDELIEVTTEFYGLGKKHIEKLTVEQASELDAYLADIRDSLAEADGKEKLLQVLKEGLEKTNKFNLFGNIGTSKAIELIEGNSKIEKCNGLLKSWDNYLCFIFGGLSGEYLVTNPLTSSLVLLLEYITIRSKELGLDKFHDIVKLTLYLYAFFWICILVNKPTNILATYIEFVPFPYGTVGKDNIISIGKKGEVHFDYVDTIFGFTGIKILNPIGKYNQILFGYALGIKGV